MAVRLSALCAGHSLPLGKFLALISVKGSVDPRSIVRLEGLGELKYPMSSSGIESATFRLVSCASINYAAACPLKELVGIRFEGFKAVKIHIVVFWVIKPCSLVRGVLTNREQKGEEGSMFL
jgi:hypothetical protein